MGRLVGAVALFLVAVSCAGDRSKSTLDQTDPLDRAVSAMGGQEKLGAIETYVAKGTATHWEPHQSVKPGGEMRLAGDSTFVVTRSFSKGAARTEWVRKMVYPSPREYRFTEIVTPAAGAVEGIDSTALPKRELDGNPPMRSMSGMRLAAAQRELLRTSPNLIWMMKSVPAAVSRHGSAYFYRPGNVEFVVTFDPATGFPARIGTRDADNIEGDSSYDLVLSDWRDVSGVKIAHKQSYELNGREVIRIQIDEAQVNPPVAAAQLEVPAVLRAAAAKPAAGPVPYQWVIRRQFIGTYLDSDAVSFDSDAVSGLKLTDVSPGISQVVGGSHNSLVVEMADHLIVFDAPISEWQSRWTIDAAKAKYPGKPVKYLVQTHHHMDHAGGARTYVAEGATVLVGKGSQAHFQKIFAASHSIDDDTLEEKPRAAQVEEVADRRPLSDGKRTVEVLLVENPHAEGMLIGYVADARLGWVTDLWNAGRDKLGDKPTPGQAALVAAVKRLSSTPERFAGGHGSVAEYAPLAKLAEQPQAAR
ncbi:MAG TPA: MBL fold metallo-hydrolase [Myxococcales bacterium]|nr:MBL fold metallo-hydrolase [Myxococcales bacterium]